MFNVRLILNNYYHVKRLDFYCKLSLSSLFDKKYSIKFDIKMIRLKSLIISYNHCFKYLSLMVGCRRLLLSNDFYNYYYHYNYYVCIVNIILHIITML